MITRRSILAGLAAMPFAPSVVKAQTVVGVTREEIKVGTIGAYSGPASVFSTIARGNVAFFKKVNDDGGINGRKVNLLSYDDGYSPPRTLEQTRRLVEQDEVALIYDVTGTAGNSTIHRYMNQRKVPHLFIGSPADKWADPKNYPWSMGWNPSCRIEARIFTRYALAQKPDATFALIYQNDDFGKDFVSGMRDVLGSNYEKLVTAVSYEATDPTIDSQFLTLQEAKANVLVNGCIPKFSAQVIRRVYDSDWKPMHLMTNIANSVAATFQPAGLERAVGIITTAYLKDPIDPEWADDAGMNEWRAFMKKYMPEADATDQNYAYSHGISSTLLQTLRQCGDDLSRENIMRQAASLRDVTIPTALPGILLNTSPEKYRPITQLQLQQWGGKSWRRFGEILNAGN